MTGRTVPQTSTRSLRPQAAPALTAPRSSPAAGQWGRLHLVLCPTCACLTGAKPPLVTPASTPGLGFCGLAAEQPLWDQQTPLGEGRGEQLGIVLPSLHSRLSLQSSSGQTQRGPHPAVITRTMPYSSENAEGGNHTPRTKIDGVWK